MLYVVGFPAGHGDDLTLRARRAIESAVLCVASDVAAARGHLSRLGIDAVVKAVGDAAAWGALAAEGDVALLVDGARPGLGDGERRFVSAAVERGVSVAPVPGPALPLTALVVSGLPADSFLHVGELPEGAGMRAALIEACASERRTLLFLVRQVDAAATVRELHMALGDRPLVVVFAAGSAQESPWRGTLEAAGEDATALPAGDLQVWVVGGLAAEPEPWDEARLEAAIERRVARGEGAKELSQALADVSGWARREIYRRATERTGTRPDW